MYTRHCCCDSVRRRPVRLEKVKTDLAGLEVDVRMADGRDEADRRRRIGVCRRDVDVEEPCAACKRSVTR
jgi:hypothetical protein